MVLGSFNQSRLTSSHVSLYDKISVDERGVRWLEVPGLYDYDGLTPLAVPLDNQIWQDWFVPRVIAHRLRIHAETTGYGAQIATRRAVEKGLCRQKHGFGHLYWLYTYGWMLEPRNPPGEHEIPFLPTPRQVELIMEIHAAMDSPMGPMSSMVVEKARAVGATWIDASHHTHEWIFSPYWTGMLISIDQEAIDKKGDPNSWMYKFDFLIAHLPDWQWPRGYSLDRKKGHRTDMTMSNPETGSYIKGVASTEDAGRSGRVMKASIDEAAFNPFFGPVWNLLVSTTNHRFAYSTAGLNPPDFYYQVYAKEGYSPIRTFRFEWWQMPGRDQAWLDAQRASMKESEFRREVLIDYHADVDGWSYPLARAKQTVHLFIRPDWMKFVGIDDGYDDNTAIVLVQISQATHQVECMAGYQNRSKVMSFYGSILSGQLREDRFDYDEFDRGFADYLVANGWRTPVMYVGDRHGDNTSMTDGRSPFEVLLIDHGIYVATIPDQALNTYAYRHDCLGTDLPYWSFNDELGAPQVLEALQMNHRPTRTTRAQPVTEAGKPVHDGTSHFTSTCEFLAAGFRFYLPGGWFPPRKESEEQRNADIFGREMPANANPVRAPRRRTGRMHGRHRR